MSVVKLDNRHAEAVKPLFDTEVYMGKKIDDRFNILDGKIDLLR
jgi:hypothetical protein